MGVEAEIWTSRLGGGGAEEKEKDEVEEEKKISHMCERIGH